jgi:glucose/arabinose dehydrogenase
MRSMALLAAVLVVAGCARDVDPTVEESAAEVVSPTTATSPTTSPSPTAPSPTPTASLDEVELSLERVARGLQAPLLTVAPIDDERLFIVEQPGRIQVRAGGELSTYLDITDRVETGGERGLLGLAFHPRFADNGRLFVHYTGDGGRTTVSELRDDGGRAVAGSERVLLTVDQPASNHNGGMIAFGPDGLLYIALGDGGGGGDQFGNGQDPSTLLGTILRLDVDTDDASYGIPDDNPFVDGGGAPEVYHYGLRNPWRFAFGPDGRLFIADVGQNAIEEIDVAAPETAGLNFGWPLLEGSQCFAEPECDRSGTELPVVEYSHADTGGCAIIGGVVYDGEAIPALRGHYLYGDLCAGFIRSFRVEDGDATDERDWTSQTGSVDGLLSFGTDAAGEVYVATQAGEVFRIVDGGS